MQIVVSAEDLARVATGRTESLFEEDLVRSEPGISRRLRHARVLVIGGAGSIGGATVRLLRRYELSALHVVDLSENNLVELVRDLRSSPGVIPWQDFRSLPLDYGSQAFLRLLLEQPQYDLVLNFAALKHVRSEKDTCSLLQMIDTNIVKQARVLGWLRERAPSTRYFAVSTDKAANPVNVMGATKRLMEHVMFTAASDDALHATSARFPNVAFSDGSLLQGWILRLAKGQPLAVPSCTKRFFASMKEAAQICLLASLQEQTRLIVVPTLDPAGNLRDLESVADAFLRLHGLEPVVCSDPEDAKARVGIELARKRYPLLVTPLDTSGEKAYEEFKNPHEMSVALGLPHLEGVRFDADDHPALRAFLGFAERLVADARVPASKNDIVEAIARVVPEFAHRETGKLLDDRM